MTRYSGRAGLDPRYEVYLYKTSCRDSRTQRLNKKCTWVYNYCFNLNYSRTTDKGPEAWGEKSMMLMDKYCHNLQMKVKSVFQPSFLGK